MDDKLPPPIQITQGFPSGGSRGDDDPLFEAKINNPFSKFFNWLKRLISNEGVNIKIKPLTAIGIVIALTGGGGIVGSTIVYFFPNSSPFLHREIVYQGKLQSTDSGFVLTLPNSDLYTLKPKTNSSINFKSLSNGPALVKGNLTSEKFVIEVSEIIPLDSSSQTSPTSLTAPTSLTDSNVDVKLPELFTGLQWISTQKKVLIFTSGRRKIEQEGFHLESSQMSNFPQEFINYYITELKNRGFKETLNSINPDGITVTYSKDDLFLTFGVKNVYQGKADARKLAGYTAYIEHN